MMTDQELQQLVASNARTIQAMLEQQETIRLQAQELQQLVASNVRTTQAMLEQQETIRLQYEEHRLLHEEQMNELR
jgi:hypothetical protein